MLKVKSMSDIEILLICDNCASELSFPTDNFNHVAQRSKDLGWKFTTFGFDLVNSFEGWAYCTADCALSAATSRIQSEHKKYAKSETK